MLNKKKKKLKKRKTQTQKDQDKLNLRGIRPDFCPLRSDDDKIYCQFQITFGSDFEKTMLLLKRENSLWKWPGIFF